jgi:hypothetical protein
MRHGLEGNQMALLDKGRLVVHNVGAPEFRQAMREATGGTLRVPTMAQRVASRGGQIAYSNVSPGAAYFLDPEHFGTVLHRAGSFGPRGIRITGDAHLGVTHDLAGDAEMTGRFCSEVVANGQSTVGILWLANPDLTLHHNALGSPAHLHALRVVDGLVSSVVKAVECCQAREDTLLLVGSDHGHETIGASVHIGDWIASNGLGDHLADGSVAVASQGTAALIYATENARRSVERVLPKMRQQPWVGAILAGEDLQAAGLSSTGTLIAAVDTARSEICNKFGVFGSRWMVEDGESPPELGCGQHGGGGPQETRPFLLLKHPSLGHSKIDRMTSLVDIAPTILDFLSVAAEGMDGASVLI